MHNGGAGFDTADYSARTASVTATLDGAANDGETAEVDNVKPDVERAARRLGRRHADRQQRRQRARRAAPATTCSTPAAAPATS